MRPSAWAPHAEQPAAAARGWGPPALSVVGVALAWEAARAIWGELRFPPVAMIGRRTAAILSDPRAAAHLTSTALRILAALLIAFGLGLGLGLLMGRAVRTRAYIVSVLHLLQGVPALSWVVFAVLWFRAPEVRIGFILVIVTLPAFALYVDGAVRSIPLDWIELGQAFHADDRQMLRSVVLPAIAPEILTSWRVNLGNAVRAGVVAELIGATLGVGYQLLLAQSLFDMADAAAWTLLLVGILLVLQGALTIIERRVLGWRPIGERDRGA